MKLAWEVLEEMSRKKDAVAKIFIRRVEKATNNFALLNPVQESFLDDFIDALSDDKNIDENMLLKVLSVATWINSCR